MKINNLRISNESTISVGLQPINLERLGQVVALIGKNGSGKSRILNLIENQFHEIVTLESFQNSSIQNPPSIVQRTLSEIHELNNFIEILDEFERVNLERQQHPTDANIRAKFKSIRSELGRIQIEKGLAGREQILSRKNAIKSEFYQTIERVKLDYFKRIKYSEIKQLQEAISDGSEDLASFERLVESLVENLDYNELGTLHKSSLRFLKKLPHQLTSDFIECLGDQKKIEARISYKRYLALKEIFYNFFGKNLEWEIRNINKIITELGVQSTQVGVWKINGREFDYTEFSDGERMLFAYVLLFFLMSQNPLLRLKESILIIDEPELHLHPDAEIDLIHGIRNLIGDTGQLWIATHSINILSHLNVDEVFMIKDGVIKHPSKSIQRETISELMKLEDRVQKLSEFLTSISDWTYVNFMTQCFSNPEVIESAKKNDPQVEAFKIALTQSLHGQSSLLLDFGAGKGRLYEQAISESSIKERIKYFGLEPNQELHEILRSKGVSTIYSDYSQLPLDTFDYVILCNVLHEIDIKDWLLTLNKVIDSLKDSGYLLIIEAKSLSKGEKIGTVGYLILSEKEIGKLFGLHESAVSLNTKEKKENIICALMTKKLLRPINKNDIMNCLNLLEANTLNQIEDLRKNNLSNISTNSRIGRESAFLSQLHINARLAQAFLKKEDSQ